MKNETVDIVENKQHFKKVKRIGMILALILIIIMASLMLFSKKVNIIQGISNRKLNASEVIIGDKAVISSAQIIQRKTGTGPFDEEEGNGKDLSADDNVVRSFDQVTWTIETTMKVKDNLDIENVKGGVLQVEATLPENCKGLMLWDVDAMSWSEDTGTVSEDGLTFTAKYTMADEAITAPGKQTITLVLRVKGANNGFEIKPNFKLWLEGNETDKTESNYEVVEIEDTPVIVTTRAGYNIKLVQNSSSNKKVSVDFGDGKGEVTGRMYGYGVLLQLYNTDTEKGLRGLEYPAGDITFDVNTKLEAVEKIDGKNVTTDITDLCTPKLWNYRIQPEKTTNHDGKINDRNMHFGDGSSYSIDMPYGIATSNRNRSIYNSGNILMEQNENIIHTTINNYEFDGTFPQQNIGGQVINYKENIGCFSAGYFQIFVPDNEESTNENRTYYLTVSDVNMQATSNSGLSINEQVVTTDDSIREQHYIIKPGKYYHYIRIANNNKILLSSGNQAATVYKGQKVYISTGYTISSEEIKIYSSNKFVKFDADAVEPRLNDDGSKYTYSISGDGSSDNLVWKMWYVTKKDGTNWNSQDEMKNANIEEMDVYENISDIPEGKMCIGVYYELQDGYMASEVTLYTPVTIKNTANIGQTYGFTERTKLWKEELDREAQTITNPNATYPTPIWDSGNKAYTKAEYDESGQIITGTHVGYRTKYINTRSECKYKYNNNRYEQWRSKKEL